MIRLAFGFGLMLLVPSLALGQRFTNGGFQQPKIAATSWIYGADNVLGWIGTGQWGVANGVTQWGRQGVDSEQYAFLQSNGASASIEQSVSDLVPGQTYQIKFSFASRRDGMAVPVSVEMDNQFLLYPETLPIGHWTRETTAQFVASSTSHNFKWQTAVSPIDSGTLLDAISIASVVPIHGNLSNRGFRFPLLADGKFVPAPVGKQVNWSGSGWGVARGISPYGDHGYQYSQYCWLESNANNKQAFLTQTVDDLVVGQKYHLSFWLCQGNGGANPLTVTAGAIKIADGAVAQTRKWGQFKTGAFVATSASMPIRFTAARVGVDGTSLVALIDEIEVVAEP